MVIAILDLCQTNLMKSLNRRCSIGKKLKLVDTNFLGCSPFLRQNLF